MIFLSDVFSILSGSVNSTCGGSAANSSKTLSRSSRFLKVKAILFFLFSIRSDTYILHHFS
ncbi:hypothetical protein D8B35_09920 [Lactococcus laudensis]|nr:hypothetical protein [Lactococcus laudensis]